MVVDLKSLIYNITFKQNGRIIKLLTKLSIQNLLHPFQTFILGQKNLVKELILKGGLRCEILSSGKIFVNDIIKIYD